ncbi:MAG: 1-acyl-sn-glycerol-3-phosphate acyltransferase [Helicobacteraceae bacterium]|jgi:1-acyl-sn-glycerol-3-phosphate acyltransferase|nr:1-acyl-sn-glycerol-3-phosphate acyltransferase [Helicobacteraceae bacterium]
MAFRSIIFAPLYVITVIITTGIGGALGCFLSQKQRFFFPRITFHVTSFWLRIICGITYRVEGLENIPDYPCVIASNHQSAWETYALQVFISPLCTVLKRELLFIPFFGWSLAYMKPIAIDRSNAIAASKKVLKVGKSRLADGISVLVFPEGTRTKAGVDAEFKRTAAALAHNAKVPILPIAHNSGKFWPARTIWKQKGVIVMKIGKPIDTSGKTAEAIHNIYSEWIKREKSALESAV